MLSDKLIVAEETKSPIEPVTKIYPEITIEEAYKIQFTTVNTKVSRGQKVVGMKIGFINEEIQKLFGIYDLCMGHLFDKNLVPNGGLIDLKELIKPGVEVEIAFIMKEDIKGFPSLTQVLHKTNVMLAIEVFDSRVKDFGVTHKLQDIIADNGWQARFVLGNMVCNAAEIDLRCVRAVLEVNGNVVADGVGSAVLGNPARAIVWLAEKLNYFGLSLKKDYIILSGTLITPYNVQPKDLVRTSSTQLGSVSVRFE